MSGSCEIPLFKPADQDIEFALGLRTVAIVGLSDKPERDSFIVAKYLKDQGYRIVPVNPNVKEVLALRSYPSLRDVPDPVDVVLVFRKPEAVGQIVDDAIAKGARVVWMQKGIVNNEAARKAREAGLVVIMNKCMTEEHIARSLIRPFR